MRRGGWWRFVQAIRAGEHRVAPVTWIAAIGALVYTIVPIDLIPEMLLGPLGFVDDVGFWGIIVVLLNRERVRWEAGLREGSIDVDGKPDRR